MSQFLELTSTCQVCGREFTYRKKKTSGAPVRKYCHECISDNNIRQPLQLNLTQQERKMVQEIQDSLGSNMSDAVRTAIRVYHAILRK